MMYVCRLVRAFSVLSLFFAVPAFSAPPVEDPSSCECPTLGCDACSFQKSITFYASKCGPNMSKVKSCARPTCLPLEETTKECPVLPNASIPREPIVVKSVPTVPESEFVKAPVEIGKVKVLKGSVSIVHADGKSSIHNSDVQLKEKDRLAVNSDGGAIVEFNGGNRLHVHSDSEVEVKEYSHDSEATKKVMLNLIRGKIRNQVKEKYNGQTSYYKIQSKSAVAGVRGTDFVFEQRGETSVVETLEGKVVFGSAKSDSTVVLAKGQGASVEQGMLKPVYQMNEERMKRLDHESDLESVQKVARINNSVCRNPAAGFNRCMWKCLNNPEGEKRCRTDLPKVSCQRSRCNANGDWAEDTVLPANAGDHCPGQGSAVRDCDY